MLSLRKLLVDTAGGWFGMDTYKKGAVLLGKGLEGKQKRFKSRGLFDRSCVSRECCSRTPVWARLRFFCLLGAHMTDVQDWAGHIRVILPVSANTCEQNRQLVLLSCIAPAFVNGAAWMQPFLSASLPGNPLAGVTAPAFLLTTCCSSL